jgi:hypothetical protein
LLEEFHCRIDLGIGSHPNSSSCPKVLYESSSESTIDFVDRRFLLFFASLA